MPAGGKDGKMANGRWPRGGRPLENVLTCVRRQLAVSPSTCPTKMETRTTACCWATPGCCPPAVWPPSVTSSAAPSRSPPPSSRLRRGPDRKPRTRATRPAVSGNTLFCSASNEGYPKVRNHGEGPYWLKAATTAFTFKTLLRHYAKQALTPRSLSMKLGP